MQPVDEYALMEWLKEEALKAHASKDRCVSHALGCVTKTEERRYHSLALGYGMQEIFANRVIEHIQNGRKSQRPHVEERI